MAVIVLWVLSIGDMPVTSACAPKPGPAPSVMTMPGMPPVKLPPPLTLIAVHAPLAAPTSQYADVPPPPPVKSRATFGGSVDVYPEPGLVTVTTPSAPLETVEENVAPVPLPPSAVIVGGAVRLRPPSRTVT